MSKANMNGADAGAAGATGATGESQAIADVLQANAAGGLEASGSVAMKLLASGMKIDALRSNAVLRKDEWYHFDTAVVDVARTRLSAVGDLLTRGLSYPLANALGTTVVQWEQATDMTDAFISMSGMAESERDRMNFALKSIPVPIIHKDFKIGIRQLEASRRTGETLDTTQARLASRLVSERTEKLYFQGATLAAGGGTLYGLKTFPQRNTGNITANWAATTTSGTVIVQDILAMIQALVNDNMYGPYVLYVPVDYYTKMADDYKTNSDRTILERVLAIPGISAVMPSAFLTGSTTGDVCLVQMTSDVVDVIEGQQPTTVMWDSAGGMEVNFKVMSILIPRLKADNSGQCGVAHYVI